MVAVAVHLVALLLCKASITPHAVKARTKMIAIVITLMVNPPYSELL